jgi:hypothetical protein
MLQSLGLEGVSTGDLVIVAIAAAMGGTLLGIVSDAIMGRRGFGVLGNGLLIDLGMAGAAVVLHRLPGWHITGTIPIAAFMLGGATLALVLFGTLKNVLLR